MLYYSVYIRKPWRECFSFGGSINDHFNGGNIVHINSLTGTRLYPLQVKARNYFANYYGFWFNWTGIVTIEPSNQIFEYELNKMRKLNSSVLDDFIRRAPLKRYYLQTTSQPVYLISNDWMVEFIDNEVITWRKE